MIEEKTERPGVVVLVYSWDVVLAVLAIFGALAAFSGQAMVGSRQVSLSLGVQLLAAVSSAAYAAALLLVASFLMRQFRWVLKLQVAILALAILLGGTSILINVGQGVGDRTGILVALLFLVLDGAALLAVGSKAVLAWYDRPAKVPTYLLGVTTLWAVTAVALMVLENWG